jgi:hypothetical protein
MSHSESESGSEEAPLEEGWEIMKANTHYEICKTGQHPIRLRGKVSPILTRSRSGKADGYLYVAINEEKYPMEGKPKTQNMYFVHVLVAIQWLPNFDPDDDEYQINHKDRNNRNNNIENLEIVSIAQNARCRGKKEDFILLSAFPKEARQIKSFKLKRSETFIECGTVFIETLPKDPKPKERNANKTHRLWMITSERDARLLKIVRPETASPHVNFSPPFATRSYTIYFTDEETLKMGHRFKNISAEVIKTMLENIARLDHLFYFHIYYESKFIFIKKMSEAWEKKKTECPDEEIAKHVIKDVEDSDSNTETELSNTETFDEKAKPSPPKPKKKAEIIKALSDEEDDTDSGGKKKPIPKKKPFKKEEDLDEDEVLDEFLESYEKEEGTDELDCGDFTLHQLQKLGYRGQSETSKTAMNNFITRHLKQCWGLYRKKKEALKKMREKKEKEE